MSMLITIILVAQISGMRQHTRRQFEAQWLRVTLYGRQRLEWYPDWYDGDLQVYRALRERCLELQY